MILNPLLKAYWIEAPQIRPLGFEVTAFSLEEAFRLLHELGVTLSADSAGLHITEDIRVEELDEHHVVPNMGPIVFRGVWYPCANL